MSRIFNKGQRVNSSVDNSPSVAPFIKGEIEDHDKSEETPSCSRRSDTNKAAMRGGSPRWSAIPSKMPARLPTHPKKIACTTYVETTVAESAPTAFKIAIVRNLSRRNACIDVPTPSPPMNSAVRPINPR